MMNEQGVIFESNNSQLIAIEHLPTTVTLNQGIIIVVGGPQTRVGSHRLFVSLARELAKQGITVFRFDYAGAGDSEGEISKFTDIQGDINAAVSTFKQRHLHITNITMWGLCDAASAILLYLNDYPHHEEVKQVLLVNPWVRQEHTEAKTYLTSYYIQRLLSKDFWLKLLRGKVKTKVALTEIKTFHKQSKSLSKHKSNNFVMKMFSGITSFEGSVAIILSENDLTADEFRLLMRTDKYWRQLNISGRCNSYLIEKADHTFSTFKSKEKLIKVTLEALMKENS